MRKLLLTVVILVLFVIVPYGKYFDRHAVKAFVWLYRIEHISATSYHPDYITQELYDEINASGLGQEDFGLT